MENMFMSAGGGSTFGGKKITSSLIFGLFTAVFLTLPGLAAANSPYLSLSGSGDNVTLNLSGAPSSSQIQLTYTLSGSSLPTTISNIGITDYSGNFSTNISSNAYGLNSGAQVYVTVGGQQSNVANHGYGYGGACTYNCGSPYGLSLSQTSLNLNAGQSQTVTIYNNNNYYNNNYSISSNSNSSVASAFVSGNSVYVYANQSGNTTISVCQSSGSCASLYVAVSGYNCSTYGCLGSLSFSNSSPSLTVGQTLNINISTSLNSYQYYPGNFYISSNNNPNIVSASVSGQTLNLNGLSQGSASIMVCQTNASSVCGTVYVTVSGSVLGASNYSVYLYDNYYSPQTITIPAGSSITFRNNGSMSHTVTFDGNPYTDSRTIYAGGSFTQTFNTAGTFYFHCRFHSGMTGSITVTGAGGGGNGNVWFSPSSPTLYTGQSLAVSINSNVSGSSYYYPTNAYYVSSNSNSSAVSATVSGTVLNLYAYQSGSANISVCQNSLNFCGTLYVTVYGGSYGGGYGASSLSLSQNSLSLYPGQSGAVSIYGSGGYFVSNNSNLSVASANISGNLVNVYAGAAGNTTISVCQTYSSACASLYVTVGGYYTGGYNPGGYYTGGGLQYPGSGSVLGTSIYSNAQLINEYGTVYIVYKNTKTAFANTAAFTGLGFKFSNVVQLASSGLSDSGYTVRSASAQHPWGSWIKSGQTIYFVHEAGLIAVPDWNTFISNGGQSNLVVNANIYDFRLPILSAMTVGDSRLQ